MYAYYAAQAERCPRCYTFYDEWNPAKGGSYYAYEAYDQRCPGCEAIDILKREWSEERNARLDGISIGLRLGDPTKNLTKRRPNRGGDE